MKASVVKDFLDLDTCKIHADRMDDEKVVSNRDDPQAPNSYARYGLHWDLLEDCCDLVSDIFGYEVLPTYDYSRIYVPGNDLKRHSDRPSCESSITLNLRNIGEPWEFHWEGGSHAMSPGEAVAYRGCEVEHWREINSSSRIYQVFLHYVDANGPNADRANEYMWNTKNT
jgi:hypothetical protein